MFAGACRSSAILANVSREKETALNEYGLNLGFAFQMADDLLDYTATAPRWASLSVPTCGKADSTLPVIHALQSAGGKDRGRMLQIIQNKDFSREEFETLVDFLVSYGGIQCNEYTDDQAAEFIRKAKQSLEVFASATGKGAFFTTLPTMRWSENLRCGIIAHAVSPQD